MIQIGASYTTGAISKPHRKQGVTRRPVSNCCPVIPAYRAPPQYELVRFAHRLGPEHETSRFDS